MISAFNIKSNTAMEFISKEWLYFLHSSSSVVQYAIQIQYLIQKTFKSYKKVLTKVVV